MQTTETQISTHKHTVWSVNLLLQVVFKHIVKPVVSGHSKIGKTKILMTNGSLMKVESIIRMLPFDFESIDLQ